jgi:hypothetical protein
MVFDVPTIVPAMIVTGVAVPAALIVPIVTRLAMRFVTAVTSVRADHAGRQNKGTCHQEIASHTIEGIHRASPRGQRSGWILQTRLTEESCMRVAGLH